MAISLPDIARLIRRQPVIMHPFVRALMRSKEFPQGRIWQTFLQQERLLQNVWANAMELLVPRLKPGLQELVLTAPSAGPTVEPSGDPEPLDESENYGAWYIDVAARAEEDFAVGCFFALWAARDLMFAANLIPGCKMPYEDLSLAQAHWDKVLEHTHLQKIHEAIPVSLTVLSRYMEALMDEVSIAHCPTCKLPMRQLDDTAEHFWCKRCSKEVDFATLPDGPAT